MNNRRTDPRSGKGHGVVLCLRLGTNTGNGEACGFSGWGNALEHASNDVERSVGHVPLDRQVRRRINTQVDTAFATATPRGLTSLATILCVASPIFEKKQRTWRGVRPLSGTMGRAVSFSAREQNLAGKMTKYRKRAARWTYFFWNP